MIISVLFSSVNALYQLLNGYICLSMWLSFHKGGYFTDYSKFYFGP